MAGDLITQAEGMDPRLLALAEAGKAMRELQRAYFKTRDRGVLVASKQAEAAFDRMLAELLGKEGA